MSRVSVDFGAVAAGARQVEETSGAFGQGAGTVGGVPGAAAPDPHATALLDRAIEAVTGALHRAAFELGDVAAGLSATAASYERTESILANWHVPRGPAS